MILREVFGEFVYCDEYSMKNSPITTFFVMILTALNVMLVPVIVVSLFRTYFGDIAGIIAAILCMVTVEVLVWIGYKHSKDDKYRIWIPGGEERIVTITGNPNVVSDVNVAADELEVILESRHKFKLALIKARFTEK